MEAERGALGSLLLDPKLCDDVALAVRADEFYSPAHRTIFETMLAIHAEGKVIDPTLLIERLKAAGNLELVGGKATLLDILEAVPTATNAVWYAQIVRDKATTRAIIHATTETLRDAHDPMVKPQDVMAKHDERLLAIAERRAPSQVATIGERLLSTIEAIDERRRNGTAAAISSPWCDLNRRIGGFRDGEFYVIAARPAMGKTSLALNLLDYVCRELGKSALFVSLEMDGAELCEKQLAAWTGLNTADLRDGKITDHDRHCMVQRWNENAGMPLAIDDTPSRSMSDISAQARRLKRQGKLDLLVVDHLGLIVADNPKASRQEQVSAISRRLKILARELRVPVIALAQLNRQVENERDHRPKLSSLRESGAIEQDAGCVLFLHREEAYKPDDPDLRGQAELIVGKARAGKVGIVRLTWAEETQQFRQAAYGEPWTGLD